MTVKMNKKIALIALCGMMAATASSQETATGFFLDNYNYRYKLNPAFGNQYKFISVPLAGNVNLAMRGSLHLTDVFHSVNGKTVLFTNPNVPMSCLNDIPNVGKIGGDININLLSGGFSAFGGYNTVSINAKAGMNLNVPKTFFELAKEGVSNRTYDIKDLYLHGIGYTEIALNHSRDIKQLPGLRVGAAVKFLFGMADFEANLNSAHLTLDNDQWIAKTNADIYTNIGGMTFKTDNNDNGQPYVSGIDMESGKLGVSGFGMAFDLGATYKWTDFEFSLAFLDLGWVSYFNTHKASTNGTKEFTTSAYTFNANDEADNSFNNEWKVVRDDLGKLYQLDNNGDAGTRNVALGTTMNIGVNYQFPMYRRLNFGLLSTTRFQKNFTWTEARLSANVKPVDCFSASANIAVGTFGFSFGWMANFYHKYFNIFLGMDHTPGKLAKQGLPLNSNLAVNMGINIPF